MTHPELTAKLAHEKWVKERSLIGVNRIRSATYFAFNVCRVKYPAKSMRIVK